VIHVALYAAWLDWTNLCHASRHHRRNSEHRANCSAPATVDHVEVIRHNPLLNDIELILGPISKSRCVGIMAEEMIGGAESGAKPKQSTQKPPRTQSHEGELARQVDDRAGQFRFRVLDLSSGGTLVRLIAALDVVRPLIGEIKKCGSAAMTTVFDPKRPLPSRARTAEKSGKGKSYREGIDDSVLYQNFDQD
jgi:hypothetical protein